MIYNGGGLGPTKSTIVNHSMRMNLKSKKNYSINLSHSLLNHTFYFKSGEVGSRKPVSISEITVTTLTNYGNENIL